MPGTAILFLLLSFCIRGNIELIPELVKLITELVRRSTVSPNSGCSLSPIIGKQPIWLKSMFISGKATTTSEPSRPSCSINY